MKWKKLGRIFNPDESGLKALNATYSSVPFIDRITENSFSLYFSARDKSNRSFLVSTNLQFLNGDAKVEHFGLEIVMLPGELGTFDDSGVMGSCILNDDKQKYIYYIGWNLGVTVPFRNSIGILVSKNNGKTFEKIFKGPIIDRNKYEPHFNASCCVLKDSGIFKMWYLSCTGWKYKNRKPSHNYHIKYAESNDKINWIRDGIVAIDYYDQYEYAISVPRVLKLNRKYHMWFSSRASKEYETYRIRYAKSADGINWIRENGIQLNVSKKGWDSEMVCYPCVFKYKDKLYMLYNGNGYGRTGIGLAVLEGELE